MTRLQRAQAAYGAAHRHYLALFDKHDATDDDFDRLGMALDRATKKYLRVIHAHEARRAAEVDARYVRRVLRRKMDA